MVLFFVTAVPLFLITSSVTWAVNDLGLYERGFEKRDISFRTGIDEDGLSSIARQIRGYFNSTGEPIDIEATIFGENRELFNEREAIHMKDVKHLIWGVYGIGAASGAYLLGFVALGLLIYRRPFVSILSKYLLWGSSLTIGLVTLVGLIALVGFDSLFLLFHKVSFSNDFWRLDSRTDYLVRLFPQGFWFDATLFVALLTVVGALLLGGLAGAYLVLGSRQRRRTASALLGSPSSAVEL